MVQPVFCFRWNFSAILIIIIYYIILRLSLLPIYRTAAAGFLVNEIRYELVQFFCISTNVSRRVIGRNIVAFISAKRAAIKLIQRNQCAVLAACVLRIIGVIRTTKSDCVDPVLNVFQPVCVFQAA